MFWSVKAGSFSMKWYSSVWSARANFGASAAADPTAGNAVGPANGCAGGGGSRAMSIETITASRSATTGWVLRYFIVHLL